MRQTNDIYSNTICTQDPTAFLLQLTYTGPGKPVLVLSDQSDNPIKDRREIYCLFLNMFREEETLGINGKGEYNLRGQKLSNCLSNSNTEIMHKNRQLQYWPKNKVAY